MKNLKDSSHRNNLPFLTLMKHCSVVQAIHLFVALFLNASYARNGLLLIIVIFLLFTVEFLVFTPTMLKTIGKEFLRRFKMNSKFSISCGLNLLSLKDENC